jgi:hypothetical protein
MLPARVIGGRVTEVEVTVRAEQLDEGAPVALRDTLHSYDLVIDFRHPPEVIAAALTDLFQEGVDSGRWNRNDTRTLKAGPSNEAGL